MNTLHNNSSYLKNFDCFAISFKEFLNWSAYGILRINRSRIHYFNGEEDTFNLIMDSSPDLNVNIEGEYLFVRLINNYQNYIYQRNSTDFYLKLESVERFFAMDNHAYEILIGRANAAKIFLDIDNDLTELATAWINSNKNILNEFKALRFLSIFGFSEQANENESISKIKLTFHKSSNNIGQVVNDSKGKMIYGFKYLNAYIKKHYTIDPKHLGSFFNENVQFKSLYDNLTSTDINKNTFLAISDYEYSFEERDEIQKYINKNFNTNISDFLLMSLYVHYRMLIKDYFENLAEEIIIAFAKDLKKLERMENGDKKVKALAYEVGELLPEVFVNHLYYAKNKNEFLSLNHALLKDAENLLANIKGATYQIFSITANNQNIKGNQITNIIMSDKNADFENSQVENTNESNNQEILSQERVDSLVAQFVRNNPRNRTIDGLISFIKQFQQNYDKENLKEWHHQRFGGSKINEKFTQKNFWKNLELLNQCTLIYSKP